MINMEKYLHFLEIASLNEGKGELVCTLKVMPSPVLKSQTAMNSFYDTG